ncbi:MAG TPA: hypothetical protein VLM85_13380 [Polyangiaceae bacterium]|nr:hypothetical protein [Polyangiaceae bacterium]
MHLLSMSTRSWLIVGSGALIACGALGVACSSPSYNTDGGVDSGGGGDAKSDVTTKPDGGGGTDGGGGDGSTGPCTTTTITGTCDIVAQNCNTGQECVVTQGSDGGFVTTCSPNGGGSFAEGHTCTQTASCVPGLECIQGRCAKHCCLNNDSECGTSPEGYVGRCDLNVTDNNNQPMYAVCTYSSGCQPFDIQGCGGGQTCLIQDSSGTAKCVGYPNGDAGLPEKSACSASNACNDGLMCLGSADGGSFSCQWVCYSGGGPYDAGIETLGPGKGGCPTNETCKTVSWGGSLPTWLGICQ